MTASGSLVFVLVYYGVLSVLILHKTPLQSDKQKTYYNSENTKRGHYIPAQKGESGSTQVWSDGGKLNCLCNVPHLDGCTPKILPPTVDFHSTMTYPLVEPETIITIIINTYTAEFV